VGSALVSHLDGESSGLNLVCLAGLGDILFFVVLDNWEGQCLQHLFSQLHLIAYQVFVVGLGGLLLGEEGDLVLLEEALVEVELVRADLEDAEETPEDVLSQIPELRAFEHVVSGSLEQAN